MTHEEFAKQIIAMQDQLYRVSAGMLSQQCDREDAVQSCIEKAWRHQTRLRDESNMKAWVVRILINECYSVLRSHKRITPTDNLSETAAPPHADPNLYRFFTGLSETLRLPMILKYVEGYSILEIAKILHLPQGTIKSRLSRGRDAMKKDPTFKEVQDL